MFVLDATAEDLRFIAKSREGDTFEICIIDNMTGESLRTKMPNYAVAAIAFCLMSKDPEGQNPNAYQIANQYLEENHSGLPLNLRPIP